MLLLEFTEDFVNAALRFVGGPKRRTPVRRALEAVNGGLVRFDRQEDGKLGRSTLECPLCVRQTRSKRGLPGENWRRGGVSVKGSLGLTREVLARRSVCGDRPGRWVFNVGLLTGRRGQKGQRQKQSQGQAGHVHHDLNVAQVGRKGSGAIPLLRGRPVAPLAPARQLAYQLAFPEQQAPTTRPSIRLNTASPPHARHVVAAGHQRSSRGVARRIRPGTTETSKGLILAASPRTSMVRCS